MDLSPVLETNLFQIPPDRKQGLSRLNAENELHTLVYCIPTEPDAKLVLLWNSEIQKKDKVAQE